MKKVFFVIIIFFFVRICYAEETDIDVVYLKNGSIIKGRVVEQFIGERIKIETSDGSILVFTNGEIEKIIKEKKRPTNSNQTISRPATVSGYKDPDKAFMLSFIPPIIVPIQGLGQFYIGKNDEGLFYLLTGFVSMFYVYKYINEGKWDYEYDSHGNVISEETNLNGLYGVLGGIWYIGQWIYSSQKAREDAEIINKSLNVSLTPKGSISIKLCHNF